MTTEERIAALPLWGTLRVPFMVYWPEGKPDFKVMDAAKVAQCGVQRRCGICGEYLGSKIVFVGGPSSCSNALFADPPFHAGCAEYAFTVCPYLLGTRDFSSSTVVDGVKQLAPTAEMLNIQRMGMYHTFGYKLIVAAPSVLFRAQPAWKIEWRDRG